MVDEFKLLTESDLQTHIDSGVHNHAQPVAAKDDGSLETVALSLNFGTNLSVTTQSDGTATVDASGVSNVTGQTLSEFNIKDISVDTADTRTYGFEISSYNRIAHVETEINQPSTTPFFVRTAVGVTEDAQGKLQDGVFISVPEDVTGTATVKVRLYELVSP